MVEVNRLALYQALPIVGKSMIVLAASNHHRGAHDEAEGGLAVLERILNQAAPADDPPKTPHHRQVQYELRRLIAKARKWGD